MTQTTFNVASEADLDAAIASIDVGGANAGSLAYAITFTQSITLDTNETDLIDLASHAR